MTTVLLPESRQQSQPGVGYGFWALLSGGLGALASCFAKLAFSNASTTSGARSLSQASSCQEISDWIVCFQKVECAFAWISCHFWTLIIPRLAFLVAMIACNAGMVACFVGGLENYGTVTGTALATAANFFVSAAIGYVVWDEGANLSIHGFFMVVAGTVLLVLAQAPSDNNTSSIHQSSEKKDEVNGHKSAEASKKTL